MTEDGELCYLTATRARELFARRELSPSELMAALLRRIDALNLAINAFSDTYFEEARLRAAEADRRWRNGTARTLEGIPVAVKDAQMVAGQRTTYGSPAYRDNVARQSDPMVERLLAAGAIIHARTTASEFCLSGVCTSALFGTTFNPWHRSYSPGGSSGGSAAALAAGMTTLATGTDMGGSIRVPASACGVVGYKPPHGRNPEGPRFNVDRFNHCGPLARSVADVALVQPVVAGRHPQDHDSLPDVIAYPDSAEDITGLRVAWSPDLGYRSVDPEVRANTEHALSVLESLDCIIDRVEFGWSEEVDTIASDWYRSAHAGQMLLATARDHPDLVSAELRRLAEAWSHPLSAIAPVFDLIGRMSCDFAAIMETHDVFACPTMSVAAVAADQSMWDDRFEIDGRRVDPEFGYSMTHQFNLLSTCPVISIPSGRTAASLPTGLQLVGKPFDDVAVIRAAWAFEEAVGAWYMSPATRPDL